MPNCLALLLGFLTWFFNWFFHLKRHQTDNNITLYLEMTKQEMPLISSFMS